MVRSVKIPEANPLGRLDVLLMRLAERTTRWAERKAAEKFGAAVNLWDGPEGLGHVLKTKVEESGFRNRSP